MAADLTIHVMQAIDEDTFKCFFSDTIGSKYEDNLFHCPEGKDKIADCSHWRAMMDSPQIGVGEVSWLKAALFPDGERFIPDTIGAISDILEEPVLITPEVISNITKAFDLPNNSNYPIPEPDAKREQIREFLTQHEGHYAFTISW